MTVLRVYSRVEEAYLDAAYLGGMGVEATVVDERGYGGNLLAAATAAIRLEVDDDRLEEARQLLQRQIHDAEPPASPVEGPGRESLQAVFRAILILDIFWYLMTLTSFYELTASTPTSVREYFLGLSFSERLDRLFEIAAWPALLASMLASILCFFYVRWGRTLYTATIVWKLLAMLTAPTALYLPVASFIDHLQYTFSVVALSLMYFSPLRENFGRPL